MANCKICGKPVRAEKVMHSACWEKASNEIAEVFCSEYCRWPRECQDEDSLHEFHCDSCVMIQLLNLGL